MIKLRHLIEEISENEKVDYPMVDKGGYSVRGVPDWKQFKLNGIYSDGDVLNYIHSQHADFQDDDRVEGNFKLQIVDPDSIPNSEWSISDDWIKKLAQSTAQFPPIVVDKHKSLIDGGHRLAAAKLRGDKKILIFKPMGALTEGPDGIVFNNIDTDIWDSREYVDMFFCLADVGGKHTYFCYLPETGKVISNDTRFDAIFKQHPINDDILETHGDLMGYIYKVSKLNLYSSKSERGPEDLNIESKRLIHGRVFYVSNTHIMSCWEKLSVLKSYKSDMISMLKDCGIDAKEALYEVSNHREQFLSYGEVFGEEEEPEQTTSDSEEKLMQQLHLNPDLKKKILKLPPDRFQVAADKLKMTTIQLKDLLGRNVAESMFPKSFNKSSLGSCMDAAEMSTQYLLSKGVKDFKVVEGWVSLYPDQEEHDWSTHTWIEFNNGRKFDPTKKQWAEWGFDPNEVEYMKVKKKYTPEEYQSLCRLHPSDGWEKYVAESAPQKKYGVRGDDSSIVDLRKKYHQKRGDPLKDMWRGPHQGVEFELMLRGDKPAAIIDMPYELRPFLPHIKNGKFIVKKLQDYHGGWVVSLPEESWRIDKIMEVLLHPRSKNRDRMLGSLLGYDESDIEAFIDNAY